MSEADTSGPKRFRSPPYPAIDLAKAIERARTLYGKALHHPVQSNVLADAWKYGIKSSGLWATAAALIQYGLMTDQGSGDTRRFQLTDAAIRIIKDADPASEKRVEAVKRAALAPPVFKELWDQYGGAEVSDVVVRNFLTLDRREAGRAEFSDTAANDIIQAFKATIDFAGVSPSDTLPHADEGKDARPEDSPSSENKPTLEVGVKWPKPPPAAPVKEDVLPPPPADASDPYYFSFKPSGGFEGGFRLKSVKDFEALINALNGFKVMYQPLSEIKKPPERTGDAEDPAEF